jgi:aminoglycoside phosphotransferase (APT) family kinase protein
MNLRLDDGTTITGLTRPPQGMRHRVLFGVEEASGREVAVKIELLPGALGPERAALEWLSANDGPAPRLRAVGTVADGEHRGAACLVSDRVDGEAPRSVSGWERLGLALARLARLPWEGSGLDVQGHREFLAVHERRVDDLGGELAARLPPVPPAYANSPLVLTHGDPGPGNFLDDGEAGTLIDWEDALVAPRGLDLGRAAFIALLGAGPEGYVPADRTTRASAVVDGFRAEADDGFPDESELAWWRSVAGVQFAHRRFERAGEPGVLPWREAVEVLDLVSTDGTAS